MPFAILFDDAPGAGQTRRRFREDHVAYIRANLDRILASGGLYPDDSDEGCGGLIILDTESRAEAEAFVAGDPFYRQGVFTGYRLVRWRKGFLDRRDYLR